MGGSLTTKEQWYGALANGMREAWTEKVPGRKEDRILLKQISLVKENKQVTTRLTTWEANTKQPIKVRLPKTCRGPRAWHGTTEESGNWEAPLLPARRRAGCANKTKANR
jgi:hypothetical protein